MQFQAIAFNNPPAGPAIKLIFAPSTHTSAGSFKVKVGKAFTVTDILLDAAEQTPGPSGSVILASIEIVISLSPEGGV